MHCFERYNKRTNYDIRRVDMSTFTIHSAAFARANKMYPFWNCVVAIIRFRFRATHSIWLKATMTNDTLDLQNVITIENILKKKCGFGVNKHSVSWIGNVISVMTCVWCFLSLTSQTKIDAHSHCASVIQMKQLPNCFWQKVLSKQLGVCAVFL